MISLWHFYDVINQSRSSINILRHYLKLEVKINYKYRRLDIQYL